MTVYGAILLAFAGLQSMAAAWDPLPAVDLSKLRAADFRDDELDLPYYLAHFQRFAGSVVEEGPDRGFINIPVWRSPRDNKPYNARIMESILSLTYFYTRNRPWNAYYGSPAVRQRLEAAMEFWLHLQNPEGRFAEAAPQRWNLAATAFSAKFMSHALVLLQNGPPVDAALRERVVAAVRKTIRLVLTDPALYKYGTFVSNQYTNVFAGGLAFLRLYPDAEIESLLRQSFHDGMRDHQSPAGYFYEEDGPDLRYDMFTHQSNLQMVWHYARGGELGKLLAEQERKWFEWLGWNAAPEPNGQSWILNHAIETRSRLATIPGKDTPIGEAAPEARAFATSREELKREIALERRKLELAWPSVPPLTPDSYSPYAFLLRDYRTWYPTDAERDEARHKLPYFARKEFVHQLADSRHPLVFTYVRRPSYYAAFNAGRQISTHKQQRYGLGLLWSDMTGVVLQSQTGSNTAAWGTAPDGVPSVYEAAGLTAVYRVDGKAIEPKPGSLDLPGGTFTISYKLGGDGEKSLEFAQDAIVVRVRHPGAFTEFVPLLEASDEKPAGFSLATESGITVSREESTLQVGSRKVITAKLRSKASLVYRLRFGW